MGPKVMRAGSVPASLKVALSAAAGVATIGFVLAAAGCSQRDPTLDAAPAVTPAPGSTPINTFKTKQGVPAGPAPVGGAGGGAAAPPAGG